MPQLASLLERALEDRSGSEDVLMGLLELVRGDDLSRSTVRELLGDDPGSTFRAEADEALADGRERLARREFEAGRFYEKQNRLRSAFSWAPNSLPTLLA